MGKGWGLGWDGMEMEWGLGWDGMEWRLGW